MPRDDDFPALNALSSVVNGVSRRGFLGRFAGGVIALASGATTLLRARRTPAAVEGPGRERPAHSHIPFPGMEPAQEEFLFHPHYRLLPALDEVLKKTDPRLDEFPTEVWAAEITRILDSWRNGLMQTPPGLKHIGDSLAPSFTGSGFEAKEQLLPRSDDALEIRKRQFLPAPVLPRPAFLSELKSYLGEVRFLRVEFKIVAIRQTASGVDTSVRYDFVDAGPSYHRQQRVGTMNLRWQPGARPPRQVVEWRMIEETISRSSRPMFEEITARALGANKSFGLQLARGTDYWRSVLDGASGIDVYGNYGLAVGDIDNDGWDDLYICQPSGLPNRLFRNRGDGTFEDVTGQAGVGVLDSSASALFADIDNDGRQDLIVVRGAGPLLFLNQGNGKFLLKKDAFHFATAPQGTFTGAAIADYDRDGWLDIYFCLYAYYQGPERYRYPVPYANAKNGPPNFLFRNNRNGTFSDATAAARLNQNNSRFSFACGWCDYDRDGWPDLYVANDFGQKNLYHNNRDGAFTDLAGQAGVLDTGAGMSVCWDDFNNDGWPDLYVADMWTAAGLRVTSLPSFMRGDPAALRRLYRNHAMGNSLYRNNRHGGFEDVTRSSETANGGWAWSSDAWDFDQDGYLDLYIANGMISGPERQDLSSFFWRQVVARSPSGNIPTDAYEQGWNAINELIRSGGTWSGYQANVLFANNRDGTFASIAGAAGLDCLEDSRSFALADIDHDGRLELIVKNRSGPQVRIFRNVMRSLGNSVSFRLTGTKANRDAIGALITVKSKDGEQVRSVRAGSGFLAQHSKEVLFGLGRAHQPLEVTIQWPGGAVETFQDIPPNHRIDIQEGAGAFHAAPYGARPALEEAQRSRIPPEPELPRTPDSRHQPPREFETWLLVPVEAPAFSLPDFSGHLHALDSARGKITYLNFWSMPKGKMPPALADFGRKFSAFQAHQIAIFSVNAGSAAEQGRLRAQAAGNRLGFPVLLATPEVAAIYNLLYRYTFDQRRDLTLPASFLIDKAGMIVKIYRGDVQAAQVLRDAENVPQTAHERITKALPFEGTYYGGEFVRNDFTYGVAFAQHGYYDAAEPAFLRAIKNQPASADAYYDLGTLYMRQQKWEQAEAKLRKAVELEPQDLMGYNNLGVIAAHRGRAAEAAGYFNRVLKTDAGNVLAIENLADLDRFQGKHREAEALLRNALVNGPENPQLNYKMGMVLAGEGRNSEAQRYLEKAAELEPANAQALDNLGVLYVLTGQTSRAVETFSKCIRRAPKFDQAYLNLARVEIQLGKPQEAARVLRELLKQAPGHPLALEYLHRLGQ